MRSTSFIQGVECDADNVHDNRAGDNNSFDVSEVSELNQMKRECHCRFDNNVEFRRVVGVKDHACSDPSPASCDV